MKDFLENEPSEPKDISHKDIEKIRRGEELVKIAACGRPWLAGFEIVLSILLIPAIIIAIMYYGISFPLIFIFLFIVYMMIWARRTNKRIDAVLSLIIEDVMHLSNR